MVHRSRPRPAVQRSQRRHRRLTALLAATLLATACSAQPNVDLSAVTTETAATDIAPAADPLPAETTPDITPETTTEPDSDPPDLLTYSTDEPFPGTAVGGIGDGRSPTPTPTPTGTPAPPGALVDLADDALPTTALELAVCGDSLECGAVEVPADHRDPTGDTLRIAINVLRSPKPDARIGYLFVNPGGPGVSGVDFVAELRSYGFPQALLDAFDIVGFDPRGVGASEPHFACGVPGQQFALLDQIDDYLDSADEFAAGDRAAELCTATMGPSGALLGSEFVAHDMDWIRRALGAERISYLGFSYGSSLGGWYASLFPERVRAMVLDAAANPLASGVTLEQTVSRIRNSYGEFHERLDDALSACDATCPIWNDGDPHAYWYGMVDRFDLLLDAENGNGDAVFFAIIGHLYSDTLWPDLYVAIRDLAEYGDPSAFQIAIEYAGDVDGPSLTGHINCLDRWALFPDDSLDDQLDRFALLGPAIAEALDGQYPLLDGINMPTRWDPCLFYEAIDPPEFTGTYDGGGIPILVVANTEDPFTSFENSKAFATDVLTNGRLVEVAHGSHTVYPDNSCVVEMVHAALLERSYPTDQPVCPREG